MVLELWQPTLSSGFEKRSYDVGLDTTTAHLQKRRAKSPFDERDAARVSVRKGALHQLFHSAPSKKGESVDFHCCWRRRLGMRRSTLKVAAEFADAKYTGL